MRPGFKSHHGLFPDYIVLGTCDTIWEVIGEKKKMIVDPSLVSEFRIHFSEAGNGCAIAVSQK